MKKKVRKRCGARPFLKCWSNSVASIVLCYLASGSALKAQDQSQPTPAGSDAPTPSGATDQLQTTLPPPTLQRLKPKKNEVSVSGDFMFGKGTVTLPIGYSLKKSLGGLGPSPFVDKPTRSSEYYGATLSYSYGEAWYFDLSYSQGRSSGSQTLPFGSLGSGTGNFSLNDDWYQAYLRYAFPQLRGKRLSAYLRAGVTYIDSKLVDNSSTPAGLYSQNDKSTDLRGNLGAGLTYGIYSTRRFRIGVQVEGEGFFGYRSQDSLETLNSDFGLTPQTATINNTLYGGLARAVMHFEYRFGRTGLLRAFLDGGAEADYTMIDYPSAGSSDELLWGPYVKLGLRYSF